MKTALDPLVTFQTGVAWSFAVGEHQTAHAWGGTRYKSDFIPGETLLVPQSIAEAREAAGLGRIIPGQEGPPA